MNNQSPDLWTDEQKWNYLVRHERLGELLVRHGKLNLNQLEEALKEQTDGSGTKHLGEIIVAKKYLTLDEIFATLNEQKQINLISEGSILELKQQRTKE